MKNDNIKSDWKKYTITQKISFVLVVLIFALLILGSVGGLLYLFKPKKVNADEIIIDGGSSVTQESTVIIPISATYFLSGGYASYPSETVPLGSYSFQQPLIFKAFSGITQSYTLGFYNGVSYSYIKLYISEGAQQTFTLYDGVNDQDVMFYFSTLNATSSDCSFIYSIQVVIVSGSDESIIFNVVDINGNEFTYGLYPYRAEQFGEYVVNPTDGNDFTFTYISSSNLNYTERLNQAKEESYSNGYDDGYREGKEYGINVGYNQGVNDTDKFTFSSLYNAIFYAPLKAFISIFNFEILGVNVLNIISFLFTMLIAIGIIRWVV